MNRSFARKLQLPEALTPSFGGVGGPAANLPVRGTGSALSLSKDEMLSKEGLSMTAAHLGVGIAIGAFAAKAVGVTMLGGAGLVLAAAGAGYGYYLSTKEEA